MKRSSIACLLLASPWLFATGCGWLPSPEDADRRPYENTDEDPGYEVGDPGHSDDPAYGGSAYADACVPTGEACVPDQSTCCGSSTCVKTDAETAHCQTPEVPEPEPTPEPEVEPEPETEPEPPTCIDDGDACWWAECCEGFCDLPLNSYGPGVCAPLRPEGEACQWHDECAEGTCIDGTCDASCRDQGQVCDWAVNGNCCDGLQCVGAGPYIPGTCSVPLADGEFCTAPSDCEGGMCILGACASECIAAAESCEVGATPCCAGVCHDGGYGFGSCGPPKPAGEWCWEPTSCASGVCEEGTCL